MGGRVRGLPPKLRGMRNAATALPRPSLWRASPICGWVLALVCGLALPAHAQWTWRDKSGQINASDRPPPRDVPDKDILQRPPAATDTRRRPAPAEAAASAPADAARPPALAASSPLEREVQARRQQAEQDAAAKARQEATRTASQRADNCRSARSQLSALGSGQRIARLNDKGEREVLDDKGRADEMRRARDVIAADCR